jgi:class 3 adenylate cyclase/tetratricopeptide (TPR) repeat protein
MTEREHSEEHMQLEQAIAALEAQRATLGDLVVDASLAALREKLAALEAPPADGQERKQVTILFADIAGFTPLSETMDPEDLANTMNALWRRIDPAIIDHGGAIDKHTGDGVMALWGASGAREDDPERAIRAGLEMQTELAAFREARDLTLAMRVGIHTGPVLLGGVGTAGEFSAMGDAVNLASRLEGAAPVGGVLISHGTYRHVRGIFDVQAQEPVQVKGKAQPVRTYVVQRAKPRAFRMATRGVEGIETRMVGRDAELLTLQNTFRDATEDAETRVVTVVGEAGVGKSRLLYEFENWLELLPERVTYFKGWPTPEMQAIPCGAMRDMFAARFEIRESDGAAAVLDKFRAGMEGLLPPERADLAGHLLGFDLSASQAVQNLLGSPSFRDLATAYLVQYVRAVAAQPAVMLLEDVHWADDSSLDLLDRLATAIPEARLLVVCLARPELFERRPQWGEGRSAFSRLELRPLSRRSSRALVAEILQRVEQVPDELRDLVVEGAEGNPFYVEELIKMLLEDGVIQRGEERWQVALERLADVRVPPTLTGVLQARLDSLPRDERTVLQRASVVGRVFWDGTVAALEAGDEERIGREELGPLLDSARGRELVFRRERSAFEDAEEYLFKHAVLRDVTYETVLLKLRRVYHAQVAAWLEAHAGKRLAEYLSLIAGHHERAGDLVKAVDCLQRSGEELLRVSAYRDAIAAFERALALLPSDDEAGRAVLLVGLGSAHIRLDDYPLAITLLEEALGLARKVDDVETQVAALGGLGDASMEQGALDAAVRHLKGGLALAREHHDRTGTALSMSHLGKLAALEGNPRAAETYGEESLAIYRELGDRRGVSRALDVLNWIAAYSGDHARAIEHNREALAIAREIGDRRQVARSLNSLCYAARHQGRLEAALHYVEESLSIARDLGLQTIYPLGNLAAVQASSGQAEAAWRTWREAVNEAIAIGDAAAPPSFVGLASVWLAQAGQHERAAELVGLARDRALDVQAQIESEPALAVLRGELSADELEAAMARGRALDLDAVVAELLVEEAG